MPLMLVANRRLSAGPTLRLSLPELTLIENYDHDINSAEGWLDGRCGFGWLSEGVLWDDSLSNPLLLVWPYEFRRVPWQNSLRGSRRGIGELHPSVGTWHPFASRLKGKPVRGALATAFSPDIAALLQLVKEVDGYFLTSSRLDNGKLIARVKLDAIDAASDRSRGRYSDIVTSQDQFAVLLRGRLFVGPLAPLRGDKPPFHLVPRQSTFVLATDKPTTVRYEAAGASRFRLSSRSLGTDKRPYEAKSQTGEFTLVVADSLERLLSQTAGLAANLKQVRSVRDNRQRAESYAGPSRDAFRRLFGREAKGVPLPIDIQVTAEGADFETAEIRHDFLVEVSLKQLEAALDKMYPTLRDPWKKLDKPFDLTNYPAAATPPTLKNTLAKYSRDLWVIPHPRSREINFAKRRD